MLLTADDHGSRLLLELDVGSGPDVFESDAATAQARGTTLAARVHLQAADTSLPRAPDTVGTVGVECGIDAAAGAACPQVVLVNSVGKEWLRNNADDHR